MNRFRQPQLEPLVPDRLGRDVCVRTMAASGVALHGNGERLCLDRVLVLLMDQAPLMVPPALVCTSLSMQVKSELETGALFRDRSVPARPIGRCWMGCVSRPSGASPVA